MSIHTWTLYMWIYLFCKNICLKTKGWLVQSGFFNILNLFSMGFFLLFMFLGCLDQQCNWFGLFYFGWNGQSGLVFIFMAYRLLAYKVHKLLVNFFNTIYYLFDIINGVLLNSHLFNITVSLNHSSFSLLFTLKRKFCHLFMVCR